jgi:hypothetical protein
VSLRLGPGEFMIRLQYVYLNSVVWTFVLGFRKSAHEINRHHSGQVGGSLL